MNLIEIRKLLSQGVSIYNIHLKVVSYARVSTSSSEQLNSLSNQNHYFENLIDSNKEWEYIGSYIDEGISGIRDVKRNAFMKMINDAKLGKFDLIVTKEISRFSRNTLDSIKYTRLLLDFGVAVLFINDNINTADIDSELRLTIMSSLAQDEIRRLSERVKFGINEAIKRGSILGNNMLYGYKKNKTTGNLEVDEFESKVVFRLYSLYAIDKVSLNNIAKIFNKEKIKTVNHKLWCVSTLSRMIKNPKYKGYYCAKKSEVVNYMSKTVKKIDKSDWVIYKDNVKIPPIVTEELWNLANRRLEEKNSFNCSNRYPLSGKIICSCNSKYTRKKNLRTSNDITWMCSNYLNNGKSTCASANIRESELYDIFKNLMSYISEYLEQQNKSIMYTINEYNNTLNNRKHILKEIKKIKNRKDKLIELRMEDLISIDEYRNNSKLLDCDLKKLEENLNKKDEYFIEFSIHHIDIINILIDLLIDKIIVKRINEFNTNLNIVINSKYILFKDKYRFNYTYRRGVNTRYTSKYDMNYSVSISN